MSASTVTDSNLTPRQEARRQRVIEAALKLGAEGGYDAVQMRSVAATARVALGTIYRYFSSKDHLLAAALVEWTAQLQRRVALRPARGETPADRVVDVLRRGARALEREPRLAEALVKALASPDPSVGEATAIVQDQVRSLTDDILEFLDERTREDVNAVVRHVWYSSLQAWANGRADISTVGNELERAVRLVLREHERAAPTKGASPNGARGRATDRTRRRA